MPGWKKPSECKVLGKRITRLDGPIKVTGKAKYAYDINLPGLLYGRLIASPHAAATIKSIDVSAAEKMPGVKAVIITAKVGEAMRFQGQEIGALCATSSDIAEDAIRAVKITYDVKPHVVKERAAAKPGAAVVLTGESNVVQRRTEEKGNVTDGFAKAAATISGEYFCAVRAHACLETHGVTSRWDDDKHLTCWSSTQYIFGVRDDLARHFQLPADNVQVITDVMGGGFGSKFGMGYEGRMSAELAKKAKAPVKLLLTRRDEHLCVGNAPSALGKIKMGATADGKIVAFEADVLRCGGVATEGGPMPYIYDVGASKNTQSMLHTNTGPSRAWRAPAHPQSSFLMECAMEDLAVALGMDSLDFRLKNDPNPMRQKQWKEGARLIGWERRNPKPGVGPLAGTGRFRRGIGCGAAIWGGGGAPTAKCKVTIMPDGTVTAEMGVQDIGTGTRTLVGMIVEEELGLSHPTVKVGVGRSSQPPGVFSGGSVTTPSIAPPTKRAAEAAKTALLERVAGRLNVPAADLDLEDGKVIVKSDRSKDITFKQACAALPMTGIQGDGAFDASLQQTGVAGAQFYEVEVDIETGRVTPIKAVALQDGGVILNPLLYESQLNGGVIQGIGMALMEDRRMCQLTGRMVNANFEEYKLPGPYEMPEFVTKAFENPDATGVTGMSEAPVIPPAGAIRAAILNATGAAINEAPMTPALVLEALAAARKRGVKV
jgi:xanthine dehydrogenase YagR molybdenum-binding subunit